MPAHTQVCQCSPGIQAEQWPQRSQQMIKAPVCPCFLGFLLYHLTSLLADGFIPTPFGWASSKNVGRRWKQLVQGGLGLRSGPCFPLFCLAEQTAPGRKAGRERKRGGEDWGERSGDRFTLPAAGWVARTPGVQREPFLFCAVRMGAAVVVWGPLPALGWDCTGSPISQQPPSLLVSHRTAVTLSHIPVHPSPVPDQLGVCSVL